MTSAVRLILLAFFCGAAASIDAQTCTGEFQAVVTNCISNPVTSGVVLAALQAIGNLPGLPAPIASAIQHNSQLVPMSVALAGIDYEGIFNSNNFVVEGVMQQAWRQYVAIIPQCKVSLWGILSQACKGAPSARCLCMLENNAAKVINSDASVDINCMPNNCTCSNKVFVTLTDVANQIGACIPAQG